MRLLASLFRKSSGRHAANRRRNLLIVEQLEDRCVLTVFTPAQIAHAYGFDQVMFGSVKGDGTGQTIAIIDAYDAPKINADLQKFNAQFGLSNNDGLGNYVLTKVTPPGQGTPAYNAGWSQEITLDVQWAHAIAPGAHILLVEAASNSFANLFGAVDYARNYPGVSAISMSWGSNEFAGESSYDYHLTTPAGHNGVSFIASSGDVGAVVSYPAVSPNVLGVGGTSVQISSGGTWLGETVWSGSGGGVSAYESKPSFQIGITQSSTKRTSPDVAYDADPNTGVYVYWTNAATNKGGWYSFGGTSAGAPQWAALVAIANQGRTYNTDPALQGSLDGRSQLLPAIYNLPAADFHDETSGKAGGRRGNSAGPGYDLATGRGSPIAQLVVGHLITATSDGTVDTGGSGSGSGGGSGSPVFIGIGVDAPSDSFAPSSPQHGDVVKIAVFEFASRTDAIWLVDAPMFAPGTISDAPQGTPRAGETRTPLWMTFGSGISDVVEEADPTGTVASWVIPLGDGSPAPGVVPAFAEVPMQAPPAAAMSPNENNAAPAGETPVVETARVETEVAPRGLFAKSFVNVFWLAGAVAFFANGAFFGKERDRKEEEREPRAKV